MHPLLRNFSIFSMMLILQSEDVSINFLTDLGLLPDRTWIVNCPKCNRLMKTTKTKKGKLHWKFVCSGKNIAGCNGEMWPTQNTFFYNVKIPFNEILAIVFCFVLKLKISFVISQLTQWRSFRNDKSISRGTIQDVFRYCREVAEIVASHNYKQLGGRGKTPRIVVIFCYNNNN